MASIEVRVDGRGRVDGGEVHEDASVTARCELCGQGREAVASIGEGRYACPACLRDRLDALSVARFRMANAPNAAASGLPWGKVSG